MGFGGMNMGRGFGHLGSPLGSGAYNPITDLGTDLIAWWDADSSYWGANGAMTIATGVSSWKDIVAGYDMVQATGAAQPAFSATNFNGNPCVAGDGLDDNLTCTDAALLAALATGTTANELWLVAQNDTPGATTTLQLAFGYGGSGTNTGRQIGRFGSGGAVRGRSLIGDGATGQVMDSLSSDLSARYLENCQVGAAAASITINGIADGSLSVVPSTQASRVRLFASSGTSAGAFYQGKIVAAMFTKALSAQKRTGLQTWGQTRRSL